MKLTIAITSTHRFDLLEATLHSLLATIGKIEFDLLICNNKNSLGEKWNYLIGKINTDFVLMCQEDWYFIESWNWLEECLQILEFDKEIGIIRLRKDEDGQTKEKIIETKNINTTDRIYNIVDCVGGGFSLNPFICRNKIIKKLGKVKSIENRKGIAELELRERYKNLNYKTAKLNNPARGICIHIGRGRRVLI